MSPISYLHYHRFFMLASRGRIEMKPPEKIKKVKEVKRGVGRPKQPVARELLLQIATELFARKGYHAVSIREIARNAGVNSANISYHFENKQGLYEEILSGQSRRRKEIIASIENDMVGATAKEKLLLRVKKLSEPTVSDLDFKRLIFRTLMDTDQNEMKQAIRQKYIPAVWESCELMIGNCTVSEKFPFLDWKRLSLLVIGVHNFWTLYAKDFDGALKLDEQTADLAAQAHQTLVDLLTVVLLNS